jgi:hypothetical protein
MEEIIIETKAPKKQIAKPKSYKNGKIYTIRSYKTDMFYIGSTTQSLSKRLSKHKQDFLRYKKGKYKSKLSSFQIIELDDAYIELLEECPSNSKLELEKREGELIRLHKDSCVNINMSGISWKTNKKYQGEYREKNREKYNKAASKFYQANKDKVLKMQKEYKKRLIFCVCGITCVNGYLSRHKRCKEHLKYEELKKRSKEMDEQVEKWSEEIKRM